MRGKMNQLVQVIDRRITVHDFRMVTGPTHTNLIFDVAAPFDVKLEDSEIRRQVEDPVSEQIVHNYTNPADRIELVVRDGEIAIGNL